ncbi:MAG: 16S rRNA (cytosine(1402)-N(4))-methyltransferase RsmH [Planctomycetes bacterium]|nr:16S rRNA (cytosine(1402)-N(4))-methyltransferase RsmH [Planctomycetota bacterium]
MSESSRDAGAASPAAHRPVLLREVLRLLSLEPGLTVVDGTVGAGGHSRRILEKIGSNGTLIGLDRDPMMLQLAGNVLHAANCHLRQSSYSHIREVLQELNVESVDRILLDLGLSSDQLNDVERGFGYDVGGPLDLRFDTTAGLPAWKWIERADEQQLADVIHNFGEERFSGRIAAAIARRRKNKPVRTAADLVETVFQACPRSPRKDVRRKAVSRVFQAFRIAVNEELNHLQQALEQGIYESLRTGGRSVVISFHSLEDRLVKTAFRDKERWQNLTPKPIRATSVEKRMNPRCRTALLRAAIKRTSHTT